MKKKAYCIMSGGMDSSLSAAWATEAEYDNVRSLFFDWGQKSVKEELDAVKAICAKLGIESPQEIKIPISVWDQSSLTQGNPNQIDNSNFMVPERNLVFIAIAASYARAKGGGDLIVGFNRDDGGYDTKQGFVDKLNALLADGSADLTDEDAGYLRGTQIELVAPLMGKGKKEIRDELKKRGLLPLTYSCYAANGPCGKCNACLKRNRT
jgi:7-cyano-7-deazaguanine synthase